MAKHKASTQVTVAPLFEKSTLEKTVDQYKLPAIIVLTLAVVWVLYSNISKQSAAKKLDSSWEALFARTTQDPMTRLPSGEPAALGALADDLVGTHSGPWARLIQAQSSLKARDFGACLDAVGKLKAEYPTHALVVEPMPLADGSTATVADHLEAMALKQQAWDSSHPELFTAPVPPAGSPRVILKTDAGDIEVALFSELAPKHVENFLKLCSEGFYDGTRFHRVMADFMIQGGDPNSRSEDRISWGQGGADDTVPAEPNGLFHFAGVLSAAKKPGDIESSGSQFFITTKPAHHLDDQHTIFGTVVAGKNVVDAIGAGALTPNTVDQPVTPVVILSTVVAP